MKAKRIAFLGLCVSLSMILSYFESLVPPLVAVPGVKAGFANLVTIFMLYKVGVKQTAAVTLVRVILVSILFGSAVSMVYSLVGAGLSLAVMIPLKKWKLLSCVGVSVAGGVLHNVGQVLTACILMETSQIIFYLPVLLISGTVAGVIIGLGAAMLIQRLNKVNF